MISGELKYTAIKFGEAFAEAYELCQTFPAYRDEGAHTAEAISAL